MEMTFFGYKFVATPTKATTTTKPTLETVIDVITKARIQIMTGIQHLQASVTKLTEDTAANQKTYLETSAANTAAIKTDIQILVDRAKDGAAAAELDKIAEGVATSLDKQDSANGEFAAAQVKASNDFAAEIDKIVNPPASTTPPVVTPPADPGTPAAPVEPTPA